MQCRNVLLLFATDLFLNIWSVVQTKVGCCVFVVLSVDTVVCLSSLRNTARMIMMV